MKFSQLYNELTSLYPTSLRCEWDNDGMMCANNIEQEVKRVLISLDVTLDVVNYAIENKFDTIISHHPLVFRAQKALTPLSYTQNKLIALIKNNVNVMSFHNRLDDAQGGVNDTLCQLLGWINVEKDPSDPIGRVAYLEPSCDLKHFAAHVKQALSTPVVLYNGEKRVSKVYAVGGDGKDLIENAISLGCDTVLTGRASYNTAVDACDMGINIVEAGHFYTENPVCNTLKNAVLSVCADAEIEIYFSSKIQAI